MLQKIEHYISALAQLEQAVVIYQKSQQDALYRDGLIQRFEFTVELAWKSFCVYTAASLGRLMKNKPEEKAAKKKKKAQKE